MTVNELSEALATRGLIAQGQPLQIPPGPAGSVSPWYVQVMMGACAWFAGLMLLGFVMIGLFEVLFRGHDNWSAVLVVGLVACAGAAGLYGSVNKNSAFGTQFALAMSYAGQTGIAVGLGGLGGVRAALWGMVVAELALVVLVRNRLHRVLTTVGAVFAWALATHEFLFQEVPGVSFWGSPHPETYDMSVVSVVLWMVVWAPVAGGAYWLVRREGQWMSQGHENLLRPVTHGAIAALSIAPLATHPATFWMALGLGSTAELTDRAHGSTALWPLLAMILALLALALAFAVRNRPLMGFSIVFGLLEVGCFYYVLGTSLLVKSVVMVALGVGLMGSARWLAGESKG